MAAMSRTERAPGNRDTGGKVIFGARLNAAERSLLRCPEIGSYWRTKLAVDVQWSDVLHLRCQKTALWMSLTLRLVLRFCNFIKLNIPNNFSSEVKISLQMLKQLHRLVMPKLGEAY